MTAMTRSSAAFGSSAMVTATAWYGVETVTPSAIAASVGCNPTAE
jgi:hypothetical protein